MKYNFSKENALHLLKVLGYVVAANVVGSVIVFLQDVEFPKEYALYVSLANTLLVAAKEYLSNKR